jgi:hypothetical protein
MAKARNRWPVEGSIEGEPSFSHFERGPLAAAREYFSRYFDQVTFPPPAGHLVMQLAVG